MPKATFLLGKSYPLSRHASYQTKAREVSL